MQSLLATFCKNRFPATFNGHLEFLYKTQKHIYLGNGAISKKFWTHRVSAESTGNFSQKSLFCHFLVAILNFCVKHKTHLSGKPLEIK